MESSRGIILVLVIAAMLTVTVLPCSADQKNEKDIWTEDESRGPRPGQRPGPGPGRGPGWWPRRFELTDEEIDRIMKSLKESDPAKAKELAKLRQEDPNNFQIELRRHGREELRKIMRERADSWMKRRRAEFLEWLGKKVPRETQELTKLKEIKPDLYAKKFELVWRKYWRIFEESKRNPELAEVLLEDLELQKRRGELLSKIKAAKSEREKKKLVAELEEVVAGRFDLIVRRKQIAYKRLLKWLQELEKSINESRSEIGKWMDDKFKSDEVEKRMQDLLEPKFRWD